MLPLVADISLRIVAAAAAVGLVLVVLRVRSGAARHAAWSAVLLAMLTMPALMAIVPRVDVPVPSTLALDFAAIAADPDPLEALVPRASAGLSEPRLATVMGVSAPEPAEGDGESSPDWRTAAAALYFAGLLF